MKVKNLSFIRIREVKKLSFIRIRRKNVVYLHRITSY